MNSYSRCYATISVSQKLLDFFAQLTNTNKHLTTGWQRHFRVVKKHIVLILNFVTRNSKQTVIQSLACDKVYCTHNNRQHIFKIFRACMPKNVGASYTLFRCFVPHGVRVPPIKNHCTRASWDGKQNMPRYGKSTKTPTKSRAVFFAFKGNSECLGAHFRRFLLGVNTCWGPPRVA